MTNAIPTIVRYRGVLYDRRKLERLKVAYKNAVDHKWSYFIFERNEYDTDLCKLIIELLEKELPTLN